MGLAAASGGPPDRARGWRSACAGAAVVPAVPRRRLSADDRLSLAPGALARHARWRAQRMARPVLCLRMALERQPRRRPADLAVRPAVRARAGGRILGAVIPVLTGLGLIAVEWTLRRRIGVGALLAFATIWSPMFGMGLLNFGLALALALFAFALWVRLEGGAGAGRCSCRSASPSGCATSPAGACWACWCCATNCTGARASRAACAMAAGLPAAGPAADQRGHRRRAVGHERAALQVADLEAVVARPEPCARYRYADLPASGDPRRRRDCAGSMAGWAGRRCCWRC